MIFEIPKTFASKSEEIDFMHKNQSEIIFARKNTVHFTDAVTLSYPTESTKGQFTNKAETVEISNPTVLNAKLVINTTNVIDSHMDCHIQGLWKKTLSEPKLLYLLKEHRMGFGHIIADSVKDGLKAYTQTVNWKDLGYSYKGNTEALIFDCQIKKDVNEEMFDLYAKGRVYNHSVGMRYVKLYLCINSDEPNYSAEKDNWDKYIGQVVNVEVANQKGYFWAVTEAKLVEGSAVVKGSNEYTPAMEIEIEKNTEAVTNTSDKQEPSNDTQNKTQAVRRRR